MHCYIVLDLSLFKYSSPGPSHIKGPCKKVTGATPNLGNCLEVEQKGL